MTLDAFTVEWRSGLQRMRNIVPDGDVVAEQMLADTAVEKRSLVENGHSAKVIKHEADDVERSSGFENHRVLPCWHFTRACRFACLARSSFSKIRGVEHGNVRSIRLLPSRGIIGNGRDGDVRRGLRMPLSHSTRVENALRPF